LLHSSDHSHWNFDLAFLKEQAKRDIRGDNATRLFNLPINRQNVAKVA